MVAERAAEPFRAWWQQGADARALRPETGMAGGRREPILLKATDVLMDRSRGLAAKAMSI
jgi:hypothetical protein